MILPKNLIFLKTRLAGLIEYFQKIPKQILDSFSIVYVFSKHIMLHCKTTTSAE